MNLAFTETPYGKIERRIIALFGNIRLLVCDVDGVLSDGMIYMGNNGEEFKTFHVRDGFGMRSLLNAGIGVAWITGRTSKIVEHRAKDLGINHVYQGKLEKLSAFYDLLNILSLAPEQVAYIGDDMVDLPVMSKVGLAIAVKDAHPLLQPHAHYVTQQCGGFGAVREVADLILLSQNKLSQAEGASI